MKLFFKAFQKKKQESRPGEILDQVISQSSSMANKCLLYKIANYKRGGDLIDAFQSGGQIAVETFVRERCSYLMYNQGKGQMITRTEYLRWKFMDKQEVMIPIEDSLSTHDPLGKWEDHKACWKMQYRGSLGESLLHVLIICDTKLHTKLARILLRAFPMLAVDVMEGEEYLGASGLHLAIAYNNNELVRDLIEAGADVQQRATGSFFLPRDQQSNNPSKTTDYEGLAYLGEYPLAWSACCANESVYNLLLDSNADPDAQDSFGNMILHMVVVCDKLDMFGYALRHPKQPAKNGILNYAGLTPLTLACKLGRAEVFREMLELSSREFWRYSNITCSGYPLNALDTLLPDGRTNWNSALFIILNGTKEEHLDMLDGGIIQRLLEEKWKTFARNQFLKRLLILFVHLFCLSISVYLRPAADISPEMEKIRAGTTSLAANQVNSTEITDEPDTNIQSLIRYSFEVATVVCVLSYVIFQQGDEIKNQGFLAFAKQMGHAPAKAIFLISNFLILACIPFRILGDADTEEAILLFAVPGSWFLLMFFAGAVRLTGPFVTMIYSMLTGDMFTFGIIYIIILVGFSQAFYFLYKGHPQLQSTLFYTYPSTWMALFQTTLGDYNYADLNNTTYPNLAKTVFVMFMIFVPILLLNMLIAMMGNTYVHVIEQSEKEWMKQWAKIVVTLERAVSQADAQKYLEAYSIPLGLTDDSGYETRGVMVIKSKSKTRAKQRKGAVSNWKRVGKVTLNALKSRGITGEEMRRLMWGRASISSPPKISERKSRLLSISAGIDANPMQSALSATVDAMSFTHDIILGSDMRSDSIEALNKRVTTEKVPNPHHDQSNNRQKVNFKDPLRELVLISEKTDLTADTTYMSSVNDLAMEAAVLDDMKEVRFGKDHEVSDVAAMNPDLSDSLCHIKALEGPDISKAFQSPKDIVDPAKKKEFLRKLRGFEESDSEGLNSDRLVLGKIALIRRTKTSLGRTIESNSKSDNDDFDDVTKKTAIPVVNNAEEETEEDVTTYEEIKNSMELFHLRKSMHPAFREKPSKKEKREKPPKRNKVSPSEYHLKQNKSEPSESAPPDPLEPWSTKGLLSLNSILDKEE